MSAMFRAVSSWVAARAELGHPRRGRGARVDRSTTAHSSSGFATAVNRLSATSVGVPPAPPPPPLVAATTPPPVRLLAGGSGRARRPGWRRWCGAGRGARRASRDVADVSPVSTTNEIVTSFPTAADVARGWRAWSDEPHGGTSTATLTWTPITDPAAAASDGDDDVGAMVLEGVLSARRRSRRSSARRIPPRSRSARASSPREDEEAAAAADDDLRPASAASSATPSPAATTSTPSTSTTSAPPRPSRGP